ncbi:MAG: type II toxin-antitoxin system VapC family toxin [Pseudonocardiaceae bacterium]
MARHRGRAALGGTVVLDADGVSKAAAADRRVHAMLVSARNRDARVVVSAVTLAEVLRGTLRDAATYRVLSRIAELPVTPEIGRAGGGLLGSTGLSGATVDAVVAATALRQPGPVLLVTSDPSDMAKLTASRSDIAVAAV